MDHRWSASNAYGVAVFRDRSPSLEAHLTRVPGDADVMLTDKQSTFEHFGAWSTALSLSAVYYWGKGHRSRYQRVP